MKNNLRLFLGLLAVSYVTADAYIPVLLHNPAISGNSYAFGAGHGQQVGGTGQIGGHALLWNGSPNTVIVLTPEGYSQSRAYDAFGGRQVGVGYNPGLDQFHALLWSGTANSFISLHPTSGFRDTLASGIGGNQQVGNGESKGRIRKGPPVDRIRRKHGHTASKRLRTELCRGNGRAAAGR